MAPAVFLTRSPEAHVAAPLREAENPGPAASGPASPTV